MNEYNVKKQYSVYTRLNLVSSGVIILLIFLFIGYSGYHIYSLSKNIISYSTAALSDYGDKLTTTLGTIQTKNRRTADSNVNFLRLRSNELSVSSIATSLYELRTEFERDTATYEMTILMDGNRNYLEYHAGDDFESDISFYKKADYVHSLVDHILDQIDTTSYYTDWEEADNSRLYLISYAKGVALISVVDLAALIKETPPAINFSGSFVLSSNRQILYNQDVVSDSPLAAKWLTDGLYKENLKYMKGYLVTSVPLGNTGLYLSVTTPLRSMIFESSPYLFVSLLFLFMIIVLQLSFRNYLKKALFFPVREIADFSERIRSGNSSEISPGAEHFLEFAQIHDNLNEMLSENSKLLQERIEKEQEKEHALLQYYQLQTRSHFFLNCLKSLYALLENGEVKKSRDMVLNFSNHLRYTFHDNLDRVTLNDELNEVTDYYKIIAQDSSMIILLNKQISDELLNVKVPTLSIQTFLENSYKYNKNHSNSILLFDINASVYENEETKERFIKLQISDSGKGYDEDVLKDLNAPLSGAYDEYHIGINNLRRRMAILYGDHCQTIFYNLPNGGACSVLFIPYQQEEENK